MTAPEPPPAVLNGSAARCSVTTDRLVAAEWHSLADRHGLDLVSIVSDLLTPATTEALPSGWHGSFDRERAARFIAARDQESPTLLVLEKDTRRPVGITILFEVIDETEGESVDVRLGYVLAQPFWGRGMASELVSGLVEWARTQPSISKLTGGVAEGNTASARVLTRSGFIPIGSHEGQQTYRLDVSSPGRTSTQPQQRRS